MHPGLASDVLLLAIDSRARYRTRGPVGVVVAAAELCASTLAGHPLPAKGPTGSGGRPADLVRLLRDAAPTSVQHAAAPLVAAGAVAAYEHRVLGLFPRRGHTVTDAGWHASAEHRLRSALVPGARLDPGTAAFAVLCAVSGIARAVQPPPTDRAARHAIASHLNALRGVVGPATAAVLDATVAAYRRSDSGDGFVFVGTGHCYGDEGGAGSAGTGDGGDGGGDGGGGGGD